jgi:hypothetical protein
MPITDIVEIPNPTASKFKPIKEKQDEYIPDVVDKNISRRNGMIYALNGSGGSGKTNLLLNLFRSKKCYRGKFNHIYYFCPEASFSSLKNHPFQDHENVYHELSVENLENVFNELVSIKNKNVKQKKSEKDVAFDGEEEVESEEEEEEDEDIEYSVVILDDWADLLKQDDIQKQLNKMLIKARHLCCGFIFTLQSFLYFPKILRKQLTYTSIFKPSNIEEWYSIAKELLHLKADDALKVYDYVFDKKYNHLDLDNRENKIYKNFNLLKFKF